MFIENFCPSGKTFGFSLSKYDCFKLFSSKCSLDLTEEELLKYPKEISPYAENSVFYCRELRKSFIENTVLNPIYIQENLKCNHYSVTDGQHRLCICSKVGINLPAQIEKNEEYKCRHCSIKESGYFIIENNKYLRMIKKSKYLIQRTISQILFYMTCNTLW